MPGLLLSDRCSTAASTRLQTECESDKSLTANKRLTLLLELLGLATVRSHPAQLIVAALHLAM
jgi:hypothetical protein